MTTANSILDASAIVDFGLLQVEGSHNLRNLHKALYSQFVAPTRFGVASYGDSVSHQVAQWVIAALRRRYGDGGLLGRGNGTTVSGVAIGAGAFGPVVTAPATWDAANAVTSTSADYTYLPDGAHITVPATGVCEWDAGQQTGFTTLKAFAVKRPGAATVLIEVINRDTSAVVTSVTVDLANATTALHTQTFSGLSPSLKYKLRFTGQTGTSIVLMAAFLRPFGVVECPLGRGGTSYTQQNASNITLLQGILSEVNAALMFHEVKEGDLTATAAHFARMAQLTNVDHLTIGSLPDSSGAASQRTTIEFQRGQALANNQAFYDGYRACLNFAEMTRLGWGGDGTHLALEAGQFVAARIVAELGLTTLPFGLVRDEVRANVTSGLLKCIAPSDAADISVMEPYGGGDATKGIFQNIRNLFFGPRATAASIGSYGGGTGSYVNGDNFAGHTAKSFTQAPGQTDINALHWIRLAGVFEPPRQTLANLQTSGIQAGAIGFATNGRKVGEGAGAGTGVLCYRSPDNTWRVPGTDAVVTI